MLVLALFGRRLFTLPRGTKCFLPFAGAADSEPWRVVLGSVVDMF